MKSIRTRLSLAWIGILILVLVLTACSPVSSGEIIYYEETKIITEEEAEIMAEMEHARWNVERLLDGWTWGERRDIIKKSEIESWCARYQNSWPGSGWRPTSNFVNNEAVANPSDCVPIGLRGNERGSQ